MPGGGPGVANPEGQITDMPENMHLPEEWQMPPAMQKDGQIPDMQNERSWRQRPEGQLPGKMGGGRNSGGDLKYTDDDPDSYPAIFENAVGKTNAADHKRVITALKNLSTGAELEKFFDVDQILRYMAAHTVVVNLDSYSSIMAQNYYIYEKGGQITILPWDYNYSFGGFQSGSASTVVNFPIDTPVSGVTLEDRPLFARLLANEAYKAKYHQYLQEIVDGYFANGKWEAKVSQINSLIANM
jgi:spore coat protein CotH